MNWIGFALLAAAPVGFTPGRSVASLAALMGLAGVIIGGRAVAHSSGGTRRRRAMVAVVLGLIGTLVAVLHLATSTGAIGTGHGRAGALVAVVLGPIGGVLGALALARSRRAPA